MSRHPQGVAVNQNIHTALVTNYKDDTASVIDLMTYEVISTIAVGREPIDIAIDPEFNLALVVNEKDYNVSVVDLNTYEVTGIITVGKKPQAIDINPETHLAAVANEKDNTITIIDIQTWQSIVIPVEKHPIGVAINPLDNRALVICEEPVEGSGDRTLLLIDFNTNTIVKDYVINKLSNAVAVNPYTNIAGVVDSKTDSLTLIQLPNPIPAINSINPDTVLRGSSDTSINIQGSKFLTSSLAYLNSEPLTTTFTDNHNVQAIIPGELLLEAGTYPVTVINPEPNGGETEAVIFTVTQATTVEPLPEGSFGEQYEDLIPPDATIESYDAGRFSIITGMVKDKLLNPLSGVTVSIYSHPEYGTAQTDNEGKFSIPVEGGGTITVVYEKTGLITAHRKVDVAWNEIAIAKTITMIPEDTIATTVTFDGEPSTIITHQSSTVTDEYGSRSLTMVFTGDNRAFTTDENGNEVELTTITTRATEFPTPESMPAILPPTSAYTYAAELSVDGVKNVRFDKPVVTYVDNFLGFDVGEIVPVGYYDRERAVWVPSDNGVVVRLLDTDGDGVVDAVDSTGDGLPNDLNNNGSYSDEVTGLDNPDQYQPNTIYWRVEISHFTPWDCNWPFGPPEDAIPPNSEGEPISDGQQDEDDTDCHSSFVERRSRIFHEDIPIPGTDMTLHYASNRVKGYKSVITIPASGETVPASLKSIIVRMNVAGRVFETTLEPFANQKVEFVWDGLDYLGRPVVGSRVANISVGFLYDAVYYSAREDMLAAFAQAGSDITVIRAREGVISRKRSTIVIHRGRVGTLADGWTLSAHHYLSLSDFSTLFKGDGTISRSNITRIITTVAGNGQWGFSGDGGSATEASFYYPYGVAVDSAGNIYIADYFNKRIRKVDTNGIITTVAGNGQGDYSGDGGPATEASLRSPLGIAVDSAGNIYIADYYNHRIRKVDTSGIISTVAGSGETGYWGGGYSGDGGPATEAKLRNPHGVVVDNAGNIYIADVGNKRIRKVDTNSIITTVAGNGQGDYSGDGGPATEASLYYPFGVAVDSAGNIYIADSGNHRIRKVSLPLAAIKYLTAGDIPFADENGMGYIFDITGLHKSTIDLATGQTLLTFSYDQNNQLISITDQFGNQTTIERDASGVPVSITSPDGILTSLSIEENNHLTKVTYPDDSFYSFTYTTDSLMTDEYDPNNNHFEHQYDENGRLTDALDPEEGHWSYSREVDSAANVLVSILTSENNLTTYQDRTESTGAYTSVKTDPAGAVTTISRSGDGLSETKELSCGTKLNMKYDLDSEYKFKYLQEFTKTSPAGLTQTVTNTRTYEDTDADDKPDLITDKFTINSKQWTVTDNTLTGVISNTSPLGRVITRKYDTSSLLTQEIALTGLLPVTFIHDTRGRFESAIIGDRTVTIAYDDNGNIDYLITPDNKTFDYTFDIMGRLRYENRPDGTSIQYDYDNNGNITVLTNPKNINHTFDYTANDQRKNYTTDYGCSNKVTGAVRGTETLSYAYDGSLLTSVTGSGLLNQTIGFTYDNDFRLDTITYAGVTQSLDYDNDGLLSTAGSYTITRNADNGLPEAVSDGALSLSRGFSNYGEIDGNAYTISDTEVYNWTVTERDLAGRIKQRVENIDLSTITWDYTYDALGKLTEVKKDGVVVESYDYDDNGNRETETNTLRGIANRTLTYSNEDHLLTAGTDTYQFDVDGFLTSKTTDTGTTTFNYSSRGELLEATLPDDTVITYDNDPMGRRIAKKINGTIVEKYLWAGRISLLAVYDGNDNLISWFTYADARMPVSMEKGGETYYFLYDQVGTLRAVADSNGTVVKRIDYDSFGNIIYDSNPSFKVPFRFAGGLYDKDTGLIRFGARDYDPTIGRWTAKDPIDFAGGDINLYGYIQNDPVNWADPYGLYTWPYTWKGWAGVTLGLAAVATAPFSLTAGGVILVGAGIFTIWDAIEGPTQAYEDTMEKMKPIQDEIEELKRELGEYCNEDGRRR